MLAARKGTCWGRRGGSALRPAGRTLTGERLNLKGGDTFDRRRLSRGVDDLAGHGTVLGERFAFGWLYSRRVAIWSAVHLQQQIERIQVFADSSARGY